MTAAHKTSDKTSLIAVGIIGVAITLCTPLFVEEFFLLDYIYYIAISILALSLGLIWGFGGILCFGQAAFYGLGAYSYAVAAINMGETTIPFLLGILIPALFAALLGWFMFYGRLSDVYLGVITLVVTLILFKLVRSTAGDQYVIGSARLGGFNGINGVPTLNFPGDPGAMLMPSSLFYFSMILLLLVYFGLRWLLASHFGRVIVAIRENEQRAELLGYDVRWYKTILFAIGGAIAGLAGTLFVNWQANVNPDLFSLFQSVQIIIWVIVGGLGTLIGPIVGAVLLYYITSLIGANQANISNALAVLFGQNAQFDSNLILGVILILFVLLVPKGIVPSVGTIWQRWRNRDRLGRS